MVANLAATLGANLGADVDAIAGANHLDSLGDIVRANLGASVLSWALFFLLSLVLGCASGETDGRGH